MTAPSPTVPDPQITQAAPGVWGIRLPLPFQLNHINVWVLADRLENGDAAWTLVDTGVASSLTRSLWEKVAADLLGDAPVRRVIVTHFHPDHIGLADWLCRRFNAPLYMTRSEWLLARMLCLDSSEENAEAGRKFYSAMALDGPVLAALTARGNAYARGVPVVPACFNRLSGGQRLRIGDHDWSIITSGGHSPEHACLYRADGAVLIAGDMVLPRISPNVSVWPAEPYADPLAEFLDGLRRLRELPADTLVLPSHGPIFQELHGRIDELLRHHEERLADAERDCANGGRTVAQITRAMFNRTLDTHQMTFATGEALAHLNHLVEQGRLRRHHRPDDGAWLFTPP
ncbi:MBL fold metallo-hydrolase [Niveispirillum sp.]|uniref:MBL fold metallo-hydrolase n=1 Tax=Niveispirillum sp. TaxID=1917217 RepID=UPI0025D4A6A6|nr:MBL fold metallo-hydrolase [Niveispirillum sp.]